MSSFTLAGWKNTTTILLIESLPLQVYETAYDLVETYLSAVGGWVPDDPIRPVDTGEPANGDTPETAVAAIVEEALNRVYTFHLDVDLSVRLTLTTNMVPGQTQESALTAIESQVREQIAGQLALTHLELVEVTAYDGEIEQGGETTRLERVSIATDAQRENPRDPRGVALRSARSLYDLDPTWNVSASYIQPNSQLVVTIKKYLTSSFAQVDGTVLFQYVIDVNPENLQLETGLKLEQ